MPRAKAMWNERFWLIASDKAQLAPVAEQLRSLAVQLKYIKVDKKHPLHNLAKLITSLQLTVMQLSHEDLKEIKGVMWDTSNTEFQHYFNTDCLLSPHGIRINITGNVDTRRNQQAHEYVTETMLDLVDKQNWDVSLFFTQSQSITSRQFSQMTREQHIETPTFIHQVAKGNRTEQLPNPLPPISYSTDIKYENGRWWRRVEDVEHPGFFMWRANGLPPGTNEVNKKDRRKERRE